MTSFTSTADYQRAKNAAQALLRKYRIQRPSEIKLDLLAWAEYRAFVQEGDVTSCAAAVVRAESSSLILVHRYGNPGRKRFSVAHELGHLALHSDVNQMALCSESEIFRYRKVRAEEPEANAFATELIMPEQFFQEAMSHEAPSFEQIEHLRNVFQASLTSTALRFVSLTPQPCALVVSEHGNIKWSRPSQAFRYQLRDGQLDPNSFAWDFNSSPTKATEAKKINLSSRWLQSAPEFSVTEQSRDLGKFGLLTLISYSPIATAAHDDDDDDW